LNAALPQYQTSTSSSGSTPGCRHAITGHNTGADNTAQGFLSIRRPAMIFFIMKNEPEC
jgi:hypothetical protein